MFDSNHKKAAILIPVAVIVSTIALILVNQPSKDPIKVNTSSSFSASSVVSSRQGKSSVPSSSKIASSGTSNSESSGLPQYESPKATNSSQTFSANTSFASPAQKGQAANIYARAVSNSVLGTATVTKVMRGTEAANKYAIFHDVYGLATPNIDKDTELAVIAVKLNMNVKSGTGTNYAGYQMFPTIVLKENANKTAWTSSVKSGKTYDLTTSFISGSYDEQLSNGSVKWDGQTYYVFTALPKSSTAYLYFSKSPKNDPFAMLALA